MVRMDLDESQTVSYVCLIKTIHNFDLGLTIWNSSSSRIRIDDVILPD